MPLNLNRSAKIQLILLLIIAAAGCGWHKTMTFASPSRRADVEILQRPIANEFGIKVQFVSGNRRLTLYERRRETLVYFVHVYWSTDETRVGVLGAGTQGFGIALNVRSGKEIPFEQIREEIGASIAKAYNVPQGEDPIEWAPS